MYKRILVTLDQSELAEETDTLEDMVEPYLLKIGFVIRTSRGRMATQRAYDHLGIAAPAPVPPAGQENLPFSDNSTTDDS